MPSAIFEFFSDHTFRTVALGSGILGIVSGALGTFAVLRKQSLLGDAIRPETRMVWIETPSNPMLKIVDIRAAADIAHACGALVVVDNTFATPIMQRCRGLRWRFCLPNRKPH